VPRGELKQWGHGDIRAFVVKHLYARSDGCSITELVEIATNNSWSMYQWHDIAHTIAGLCYGGLARTDDRSHALHRGTVYVLTTNGWLKITRGKQLDAMFGD
jgi:hypothetical protein